MAERDHADGERPNENAGPEQCDGALGECDVTRKDLDRLNDEHQEPTFRDELGEQFEVEPIRLGIDPVDGMPTPLDDMGPLATAIPFTREMQVCVEDDTVYVELFEHELEARGWRRVRWWLFWRRWLPTGADRSARPIYVRQAFDRHGQPFERRVWNRPSIYLRWERPFIIDQGGLVPVRPKRERCVHYKRQCWINEEVTDPNEFGHKVLSRNCVMRRTIGGAFLSVSNEGAYACDYRQPPDEESVEQYLNEPDRQRLDAGAPEMVPLFGGIFSKNRSG